GGMGARGTTVLWKIPCQLEFRVRQPPMVGPMEGAKVAVMANSAMALGRMSSGSLVSTREKAKGIRAPPASPCSTRNTIMLCRLQAMEQSREAMTKSTEMLTAK